MQINIIYLITFAYVKLCKRNKWNVYARVNAPVKPAGECQLFTHCYVGLMNERENRFLHDWEHITIYTDDQNKYFIHLNFEHGGEFWKSQ